MSLPADFDLKERVRSAVDIVDVIGATLELQPQGRNFVTRCPWHNDRRPSMTVNQQRQTWKCWPCDIGGDVFSYVMRRDGVDFPTAIRSLAEVAGIPVPEYGQARKAEPGSPEDKATLLAAIKLASDAYFQLLDQPASDDAKIARDYVESRGIDDESRRRFGIGFAPDSWDFAVNLLKQHHFDGAVAAAAGIASPKRSGSGFVDMFRGRLMFPIQDLQNRPIAMGGRVIPAIAERHGDSAGGKYINGRETLLFRKSEQLYALNHSRDAIRRTGEVLVMEGYTDVVAARQAGIEPVVAVLGTALGERHVQILKRFAPRVVLVLDGDAAGQNRADQVLELFVRADADLRVLTLPDGSDPADFISQHGRDAFTELVANAPDALDHKLARLTDGVDLVRDTHAVTSAVDTMLKIVAGAPDGLKVDQMLGRLARSFDFKLERLEKRLSFLKTDAKRKSKQRQQFRPAASPSRGASPPASARRYVQSEDTDPNRFLAESADFDDQTAVDSPHFGVSGPASSPPPVNLTPLMGIERELFEILIENPDLAASAIESINPQHFESWTARMLYSAYEELDLAGRELDMDSLLTLIENEPLKNVVVSLAERYLKSARELPESNQERLAVIVNHYRRRDLTVATEEQYEELESATLNEDDELAKLKDVVAAHRARQEFKYE